MEKRIKNVSEVVKGLHVAMWFKVATESEKKEVLDAYIAWCKSREVKDEEPSELFDELVKQTGFAPDYEGDFNKTIENLGNCWHGWYAVETDMDDNFCYVEYEDGSYIQYDHDGQAVILLKGDMDIPTKAYVKTEKTCYKWTKDHEYVDKETEDWLEYDLLATVRHTARINPNWHKEEYDSMDWVVDWVFNHVIFRSLNEIAKGNGELHGDEDGERWLYPDDETKSYFGYYSWDNYEKVFDDDECEWVKGEHVCAKLVDFERPYHKGQWKAVVGYKYPVEVTEDMKTLLDRISDVHSR